MNPETYIKKLQKLERELMAAERSQNYAKGIEIEAQIEDIRTEAMALRQKAMERVQRANEVGRECQSLLNRIDAIRQKDFNKYA
jgi:uncharacterized coiled-coil DUF342 family protein